MEISKEFIFTLEQKLQQALEPKRYQHTLGVAYVAASLAMCHGENHRTALVAGLLHDCAKNIPETKQRNECIRLGLSMSEQEKSIPELIHPIYGAYLAKEIYHITEESILLAIRNHTLGRPNMTKLEQIVYLADYFEPERTQPTVPCLDEIRQIAFQNLDKATYLVAENSIRYLESKGKKTDPMVYRVYEWYQAKNNESRNV